MSSGQLYKPYLSDSEYEYDSDSDVETDGYTTEDSFCALPGRNPPVETAMPANASGTDATITTSGTKFETAESRNTFLITINSRDRDTRAYPQPTYFTIRLPRVLRNIKQINIQQLNLLNSFFNFTVAKGNTFMYVLEQGRTRIENGSNVPNDVRISIRNGTYTADDLVTELTNALNTTPLFSGISFGDFTAAFRSTGDYSILFNTPGPIVYNSMTQSYDRNQTIGNIVARYFQVVQTVGTISFTDQQILVAYYYPVIKEMSIASPVVPPFNVPGDPPSGFTSWYEYLVFAFEGLNDPYVTQIVLLPDNIAIFDNYRNQNTFNQFLVNKYTCTYNSKQGRLVISAPSLNDSITTDLNNAYNTILGTIVFQNGFNNVADFQNKYNALQNFNGSLLEFYNFVQKQFAVYLGVNFGTYADSFYENLSNEITIYNVLNRYGWNTSVNNAQLNIRSNLPVTQVSNYWSNIVLTCNVSNQYFASTITTSQFSNDLLFFSNAGEATFGYTDIVFTIFPTSYVRTPFKSRCRQNISLMTIPRYLNNRPPETDMIFNLSPTFTPLLYTPTPYNSNFFFIRTDISGNLLFNMYSVQQVMFFTADYMRAYDEWIDYIYPQFIAGQRIQQSSPSYGDPPAINSISLTSFRTALFFEVLADQYPAAPNAHFNISFYVETQDGSAFPVPIQITWYKDRAVFMTDAEQDLAGNLGSENPRHYFKKQVYTGVNSAVMTVDVNNLQSSYFHVNFGTTDNLPASLPLRVFCVLTDAYGVYTNATIFNGYGLPFSNLPSIANQFTPASAVYNSPLKSIYDANITQLGYDISGVSNNLLDYVIRSGCNYYDPASIQDFETNALNGLRYAFVQGTNGAPQPNPSIAPPETWSLYFGAGSTNTIRDLYNNVNNIYLSPGSSLKPLGPGFSNESVIINWLQPASAVKETVVTPGPTGNLNTQFNIFNNQPSSIFLMCQNGSLALATDVSFGLSNIDTTGVSAVGFYLPPNQIVKLDKMQFKFAFAEPVTTGGGTLYTRLNSPTVSEAQGFNGDIYRIQTTAIQVSNSPQADWDDWYLYNRRNIKIGIYRASDINQLQYSSLSISSAITTMTLQRVTQVANYQRLTGQLLTREPDWGVYYQYTFDSNGTALWDVTNPDDIGPNGPPPSTFWRITNVAGDIAPTYIAGENTTSNYFLTTTNINNYNYLPRSYGPGPSVGNSIYNPVPGISSYTMDVPNGYAAVPFVFDCVESTYKVGAFYGLSFTTTPMLPSSSMIGAAPYFGPAGPFGWYRDSQTSTLQLYSTITSSTSTLQTIYWNTKITFEALDQQYNPATDLSNFGYFAGISNELQDTMLFLYSNREPGFDYTDISTFVIGSGPKWRWGQESASNYIAWDDQSGYNFLSYIYNAQIRSNEDGYATHVRAYDPIPQFTTGLRFIGKNYTDFGSPTLGEIATEIASISSYIYITDPQANVYVQAPSTSVAVFSTNASALNTSFISHEYANSLKQFDSAFVGSFTFGRKPGFNGVTFSTIGYSNAITQYGAFASTTRGSLVLYQTILSSATGLLNEYVLDRYGTILPSSIINRNRITDPLPFSFLFLSKTPEPYKSLPDEWGLGWNLGFRKVDTAFRTTITSDTFIRITQDYIYLRLNPEFNTNTLAVSGKENLSETREPTSQDTRYFSKILLNNFGGFSRAAVQLPKIFNPVLGKYDTVSCQLVDQFGRQIDNTDCDYDFVLEVTEIDQRPKDTASLVLPQSANQLEIITSSSGSKAGGGQVMGPKPAAKPNPKPAINSLKLQKK